MLEAAMWLVTIASLVGTVANIKRLRWCFWIWTITNLAWTLYDVHKTAYPQAALQAIYFGLAIWGIFAWKRPQQQETPPFEHKMRVGPWTPHSN